MMARAHKRTSLAARESAAQIDSVRAGNPETEVETDPPASKASGTIAIASPRLYCPFSTPPASDRGARAGILDSGSVQFASEFALISRPEARECAEASKTGWLASRLSPGASLLEQQILAEWVLWTLLFDEFADAPAQGGSANLRPLVRVLGNVVSGHDERGLPPLARALRDLRRRLQTLAPASWSERFAGHMRDYFGATLWKVYTREEGTIPTLATYEQKRLALSAVAPLLDLVALASRVDLPAKAHGYAASRLLQLHAVRAIAWAGDIMSCGHALDERRVPNLVSLIVHETGATVDSGLERATAMHRAEVQAFVDTRTLLAGATGLPPGPANDYAATLASAMRTCLDWSRHTGCYR